MKHVFIFLYGVTLLFLTLFSYVFIDPNLSYLSNLYSGFATQYRIVTAVVYIIFVFLLFIFYFFFFGKAYKNALHYNDILKIIGITVGILFFSYPAMLSYDIFNYLTTAKVAFFYHENPYVMMPIELIGEPFLSFTHAANKIALYAPLWILLTGVPFLLSFGNFIFMLFNFKLFISVFYILTVVLLWKMTKNHFSVVFFALNPLVIIETLVSAHNDIVMMFFALLSFYLIKSKKIIWGLIAITMSIFIKYATIILLPIILYVIWKTIRKQKLDWNRVFTVCAGAMFFIFCLSPLREEIYPWYAIWFLVFIALISEKKEILYTGIIFSFGLLLRYVPYMFFGTYLAPTLLIKNIFSFVPPFLFLTYYALYKKI